MKFKHKIFLFNSISMVAIIVVIGLVVYHVISSTIVENEIRYAKQRINSNKERIEFMFQEVEQAGRNYSLNTEFLEFLKEHGGNEEKEKNVNLILENTMNNINSITGVFMITSDMTVFKSDPSVQNDRLLDYYDDSVRKLYEGTNPSHYVIIRNPGYRTNVMFDVISYLQPVYDSGTGTLLGTLIIETNYDAMMQAMMVYSFQADEKVMITDGRGEVVYCYPYHINVEQMLGFSPSLMKEKQGVMYVELFGENNLLTFERIENADWTLIRAIPVKILYEDIRHLILIMAVIFVIFISMSFVISWFMTQAYVKPIRELCRNTKRIENGDFDVTINNQSADELGELSRSFDSMSQKLKVLMNEAVENEKKKSEISFKMLQSQINPHFLYNTLDTIRWMADIQQVSNISDMTVHLIQLLKYNISNKQEKVTLQDEILNIENYISIQKYRYGDTFEIVYDIAPETLEIRVLRFLLQPIIENAIFHGFIMLDQEYYVRIVSEIQESNLVIIVEDNGVGIDVQSLSELNDKKINKEKFTGIGLRNIEERIKLYFGPEYGLHFSSKVNVGTKVTIILPVKEREATVI